ncbi:MAG: PAS domain S-box protein [Halobacteriota archaeon]|nr:PAS domain S-box protein [Halobacteriota archaeon]
MMQLSENGVEVKSTILVAEDDEQLHHLIKRTFDRIGFQTEFASNGDETIIKIDKKQYILLLLDYRLPDMTGKQIVEKLREKGSDIPFIVVTGQGDEKIAVEMMKLGAREYIVKDASFMDLLPQVLKQVVEQITVERRLGEAEARLRKSQRSISNLMKNLPGMAYRCRNDEDRTMVFASEGVKGLTGYQLSDLGGIAYMQFIDEDDRKMVLSEIDSAVEEKRPFQLTYRIHTVNGEEKWVLEKGSGQFTEDGELEIIEGFVSDITERKRVELELQLAEEMYRTIFENSAVAITVTDEKERIVSWNKHAEDLLGMGRDDLYMRPVSSLYSPDEWERLRKQHVRRKGVKHQFETRVINKGNEVIDVVISLSVLKDHNGEMTGSIGIMSDITERKRAERALLTYKERLENLIEESPVATISTDLAQNVNTMNKSAKKLLGVEEYENKPLSSIMGLEIKMEGKEDFNIDFTKKDGTRIPLSLSTAVIKEAGEENGLIVTLKDLSELTGLSIEPVEEERIDTEMEYELDQGDAYLIDDEASDLGYKIFVDLVKHGKPGLCISRKNSVKVKKRYHLEKTPVIWLTRNEVSEVACIHPDDLFTKLQSTLINFIKEANDSVILLDGLEYLVSQNDFATVLKFVQAINDYLMASTSRLIIPLDSKTLDPRGFHALKKEMELFCGVDD